MELIKLLIELAEKEKEYKAWYEKKEEQFKEVCKEKNDYNDLYVFYRENRLPSNATIKDSLRLVARLSRQMVREG